MSLKAVELIARPPLTDIPERLRILAGELPKDVTGVILVGYPTGVIYSFGESLSKYQVMGLLYDAANRL